MLTAADLVHWDREARARFTYVADGAIDTWRSHADRVLAGAAWSGDCDDLASTVMDLLGRAGLALDRRYRLLVASTRKGGIDHQVAAAPDELGHFWVLGDTFGAAYPARRMAHRAVAYQRLDQWRAPGVPLWREGAPWSARPNGIGASP